MRDAMLQFYNGRPSTPFQQPVGVVRSGPDLVVREVHSTRVEPRTQALAQTSAQTPEPTPTPGSGTPTAVPGTPTPEATPTPEPTPTPATVPTQVPRPAPQASVAIASPGGGSVSGPVTITGSASSANMINYRLEYGAGGSPSNWMSIGQWSTPVVNGSLGAWSTAGLTPGTYTIRLVVQDRVQGAIVSTVTVTVQ
jgi:hypothetical protein